MMYRIVAVDSNRCDPPQPIAEYDSAYAAVDAVRAAVHRGDRSALAWRVVAPDGAVLVDGAEFLETL